MRGALPRYDAYMVERSTTNWENFLDALRAAGRAVDVGHVTLDGEAIFRRRFACDTRLCAPTRNPASGRTWRRRGARSCCADLVVDLAPIEIGAIERHWPAIREHLAARDPFFRGRDARDCLELSSDFEISLRKRGERCIFAVRDGEWGMRCGIHSASIEHGIPLREVKPIVCDTFPLIIMDLEGDRVFVGAHGPETGGIAGLGDYPITAFPCLGDPPGGKPLYLAMAETLRAYFGDSLVARLATAARAYLAGQRPRKMKLP